MSKKVKGEDGNCFTVEENKHVDGQTDERMDGRSNLVTSCCVIYLLIWKYTRTHKNGEFSPTLCLDCFIVDGTFFMNKKIVQMMKAACSRQRNSKYEILRNEWQYFGAYVGHSYSE